MKKEGLVVFLIYAVSSLLAFRGLLLTPGTLGHNWDWFVPPEPFQLQRVAELSRYVWKDISLGVPANDYGLTSAPFHFLIGSLGNWGIGGDIVSKALLVVTALLAAHFMFLLLQTLLENSKKTKQSAAFFGGLFYGFSPLLFNELIGGSATQFFTYTLIPLAIFFFLKKKMVWFAITLSVMTFSLQNIFLVGFILALYTLFHSDKKKNLKFLGLALLLYLLLNAYWILPVAADLRAVVAQGSSPEYLDEKSLLANVPSLDQAFFGRGYFTDFFTTVGRGTLGMAWLICSTLITVILLGHLWKEKPTKENLFWLALFLTSLIFTTGRRVPLGAFVLETYRRVPGMALFRSPQHFITLTTFSLAVVLGFAAQKFLRQSRQFGLVILALLFLIGLAPYHRGNLSYSYLKESGGGSYVFPFQLSPNYREILTELREGETSGRVLFFPMSHSPLYLETEYQRKGQGGEPLMTYGVPTVAGSDLISDSGPKEILQKIEDLLYFGENLETLPTLLRFAGISDILLRGDVLDNFGRFAKAYRYQEVFAHLGQVPNLELKVHHPEISWWALKDPLPKVYPLQTLVLLDGQISDFDLVIRELTAGRRTGILNRVDQPKFNLTSAGISASEIRVETTTKIETKNLVIDPSFEEGKWQTYPGSPNLEFSAESFEEQRALKIVAAEGSDRAGAWTEIMDFDPRNSYQISFYYKGLFGQPSKYFIEESTCGGWEKSNTCSVLYGTGSGLETTAGWLKYETVYQPHRGAQRARLVFMSHDSDLKNASLFDQVQVNAVTREKNILRTGRTRATDSVAGGQLPEVSHSRINPAHYEVSVSEAGGPFILVFSESFHPQWRLNLESLAHFRINGFANAWLIDPRNENNLGLKIEFAPQRIYTLGQKISGWGLALLLADLLRKVLWKKAQH